MQLFAFRAIQSQYNLPLKQHFLEFFFFFLFLPVLTKQENVTFLILLHKIRNIVHLKVQSIQGQLVKWGPYQTRDLLLIVFFYYYRHSKRQNNHVPWRRSSIKVRMLIRMWSRMSVKYNNKCILSLFVQSDRCRITLLMCFVSYLFIFSLSGILCSLIHTSYIKLVVHQRVYFIFF